MLAEAVPPRHRRLVELAIREDVAAWLVTHLEQVDDLQAARVSTRLAAQLRVTQQPRQELLRERPRH